MLETVLGQISGRGVASRARKTVSVGTLGHRSLAGAALLAAAVALTVFSIPAEAAQPKKSPPPAPADPTKPAADAKEPYGDQNGEKVEVANARLPNTVMRARLEDTFIKLSNPRVEQTGSDKAKVNVLRVDYEVVSRGKFNGGSVVLHTDDGGRADVALKSIIDRDHGTIELGAVRFVGNIKVAKNTNFPANIEMYVTRGDDRYDPPAKFLVSNAVVMGKMKVTTRARNWTPEEIERYTKAPPNYKNANAHPAVGVDVPALPVKKGLQPALRYVEPEGHLIGLDYHVADWVKEKTVWKLTPVYSLDQPKSHTDRAVARKGYAVAGAEVNADKHVNGIRLLFRRVNPDGTLDEKDAYAGDWIGAAPKDEATKLANDGRRVLGINIHHGAVIDRFALVVEGESK